LPKSGRDGLGTAAPREQGATLTNRRLENL
jgi:hypothetical protein